MTFVKTNSDVITKPVNLLSRQRYLYLHVIGTKPFCTRVFTEKPWFWTKDNEDLYEKINMFICTQFNSIPV